MTDKKPVGRAIGGAARAAKMTPDERKAASKKAVEAKREMAKLPRATHFGVLKIGSDEVACFVLDDGRRVISGRGLTTAIGMKGRGQGVSRISSHKLIKHNENNALALAIETGIKFVGKSPKGVNIPSDGFEAVVLQEVCESILSARDKGLLVTEQDHRYAQQADALIRGFARVGIIALVDEATGYQKDRQKDELAKILRDFVAKELQPYMQAFPAAYYEHLFRLRGLDYPPAKANYRPQYFGLLTNDIVYERLAPGLLVELKKLALKDEKKAHLHRRLTQEVGHPKLREHLASVVTVMKLSRDYDDFIGKLNTVHQRFGESLHLNLEVRDRG
ncbi:P63C domain-containing protein [Actimicrobium sp. CCC2.4]|uniref:P63C domain-containing protein n=1 Tax=Actimicrobium sp. CCC2.4 TaxID=3048606 RepID=UPI002AC8FE85|nr:P63C domain-containing protein [Actimicrobium sp. CCC2.4]MEB0133807.1 P63C domain-containing protein [Actimicrobium sp. CCC2.4]WPX31350.1 P63C domain-containing protein [Actimicrobium sp. CCC2.4]